jgi:hypothetical protein
MEYVAYMRELRNECSVLVGRPEGRSPLEKLKCWLGVPLKWVLTHSLPKSTIVDLIIHA